MRTRFWAMIILVTLLVGAAGCGSRPATTAASPTAVKTARPTYTAVRATAAAVATAVPPTAAPAAPSATKAPVSPTAVPPTATRAAEKAMLTPGDDVNVRAGPGTEYAVLGQLKGGTATEITGKNPGGDWWQIVFQGQQGWIIGRLVTVNGAASGVKVATNIPAAPTAPPTAVPQPTQPPAAQPTAAPVVTTRFGMTGKTEQRPNSNQLITVWCFVLDRSGTTGVPGTMRVTSNGVTIKEVAFSGQGALGDAGWPSQFAYNAGCKAEIVPPTPGNYQAFLVEGGQQASDVYNFTVSGELRTFIIEWKEK